MSLSSGATIKGTQSYFNNHKVKSSTLGSTSFSVSSLGFGTYRVTEHDPDHREALKAALLSGLNLIDTSTNYTDGSSERLVGEVLQDLIQQNKIERSQVVIVTKVGYVQGENLNLAKQRQSEKRPYPEMVEYSSDCWHNISPVFLEEQITRSLERLKLTQIDVLLLHNPEYFLKTSANREVYYSRLRKAFEHLESEVAKGRIQYYGVSSNTFGEPENTSEFTSLVKLQEIADSIKGPKGKSHFAVIQFPLNLYEPGAAIVKNNSNLTVIAYAKTHKLGTLTNRPLNALNRERMVRLSSFPQYDEVEIKGELHLTMGRVIELEKKFSGGKLPKGLMWGQALRESYQQIEDILVWRDVLFQQILPSLHSSLERLSPAQHAWGHEYREIALTLLSLMTKNLEALAAGRSNLIATQLDEIDSSLKTSPTLSQKVLRLYMSAPGVNCVLVGARSPAYVQDVLPVLDLAVEPLSEPSAIELMNFARRPKGE
jgi:aryl-alcohol dehydrogenase-like predicted oxidoreductase